MSIDKQKYIEMFVQETSEHLQKLDGLLLSLEESPSSGETLAEIFRSAHSIKGMAASMGYSGLVELTHKMEDTFGELRGSGKSAAPEIIDLSLEALDFLKSAVREISERGDHSPPPDGLAGRFSASADGEADTEEAGEQSEVSYDVEILETGEDIENSEETGDGSSHHRVIVSLKIDGDSSLPAARALVAYKTIEDLSERVVSVRPELEKLNDPDFDNRMVMVCYTARSKEVLKEKISGLVDIEECSIEFVAEEDRKPGKETGKTEGPLSSSLRISTAHMDVLFNQIGELIVHHSRLKTALDENNYRWLSDGIDRLKKIIDIMYGEILSVRMMPFSYISPRFKRTVRDLCRKTDKQIEFSIHGEDIKLDRSVLEELVDPVNHMLRNSLDHGIESPGERKAVGKPEKGTLEINISSYGEIITIEIKDDGRGINARKIKDIALKKGYISEDEYSRIDDDEALMLCTTPGFSTAGKVSDLSGRGVGMDVVRTRIESIGGHLKIESRMGEGTDIIMEVPLTVVVISAFIARAGNSSYAFPVSKIQRTMEVDSKDIQTRQGEHVIFWNDEDIRLHKLQYRLGIDGTSNNWPDRFPTLIFKKQDKLHSIAVDEIVGTSEIVVKPLGDPLEHLKQFSGATILGDGSIALIVDTENLI